MAKPQDFAYKPFSNSITVSAETITENVPFSSRKFSQSRKQIQEIHERNFTTGVQVKLADGVVACMLINCMSTVLQDTVLVARLVE